MKFDDEVKIVVSLQELGKVKFTLRYDMYNMSEGGVLSAYGTTRHCFLNSRTGLPVMMNKEMEDFSRVMQKSLGEDDKPELH